MPTLRAVNYIIISAFAVFLGSFLTYTDCLADADEFAARRATLTKHLAEHGIKDQRVLEQMRTVPRHELVPQEIRHMAYLDRPLPIGNDQTISQPHIVALMTELLQPQPNDTVLEIGTGSGYQAAVLSGLVKKIYSIEIVPELGERARDKLKELGYNNIEVRIGDGYQGWPSKAPFDKIILTAAPPELPKPLLEQLKEGGRMVAPVGKRNQELVVITKTNGQLQRESVIPVRFVPMTGEAQKE